jgi:methylglyoxal/glyoxal reductase
MLNDITVATTLNGGTRMPMLGLGTFRMDDGAEVEQAVRWALEIGYRHIDTAALYANEEGVGRAIRDSGVPREQVFVTTKVWNDDQRRGPEAVRKAFETSRRKLGLEYVDLYLLHWPVTGKSPQAWRVLEDLHSAGLARAIGVSNFLVHHLENLLATAGTIPMVNQVEHHPRLQQPELLEYCGQKRIRLEAWSPLMKGRVSQIPELREIAEKHGKTPAQVTLRWQLQSGVATIPKSSHRERIEENASIFDFELTEEQMQRIRRLDRGERIGADPDHVNF